MATQKSVTVARTGSAKEVTFKKGMTAKQALAAADVSTTGTGIQVRLNNETVTDMDVVLKPGDQILVVGQIRGA